MVYAFPKMIATIAPDFGYLARAAMGAGQLLPVVELLGTLHGAFQLRCFSRVTAAGMAMTGRGWLIGTVLQSGLKH